MGYRGKWREREEARRLRAQGHTYDEIVARLGVSRSSVSLWVRDVPLPPRPAAANRNQGPRRRPPNKLQRARHAEIEAGRDWGREVVGTMSERDLLLAGAGLYAGDGGKGDRMVTFANSNPRLVALFLRWLRTFFDIDESRLRMRLYLHEGLNLEAAEEYWSETTGIDRAQFSRAYRARPSATIRNNKHRYGCAHVIYSSAAIQRRILGVLEALVVSDSPFRGSSAGRATDC